MSDCVSVVWTYLVLTALAGAFGYQTALRSDDAAFAAITVVAFPAILMAPFMVQLVLVLLFSTSAHPLAKAPDFVTLLPALLGTLVGPFAMASSVSHSPPWRARARVNLARVLAIASWLLGAVVAMDAALGV